MTYALKPTANAANRPGPRPGLSEPAALEDFRRRLVRLAIKLIWNRDDAEEIVQEAFKLALTKQINTTEDRFGPWVYRTVANLCLNHRRRKKPEPLTDWIDPPHGDTPESAAVKAEQLDRLREAVEQLPERQRLALVMKTMEQMDTAGVAEIMQVSVSAVRAHLHLARRRLAELLGNEEGGR